MAANKGENITKLKIYLITIITMLLIYSVAVQAEISFGGQIKISTSGMINEDNEISSNLSETLDLEVFIPSIGDTDARVQFVVQNPINTETAIGGLLNSGTTNRINTKKLYLKHRFNNFYLTVGRQPISWSFGSLLNPVDFSLGAVALDQESMGKYQDAAEIYYPINWNSGIEVVAAHSPSSYTSDYKWAVRGRTGIGGYDLTLNYVKEPTLDIGFINDIISDYGSSIPDNISTNINNILNQIGTQQLSVDRAGFTAKGDLGPIGAYTSAGYYRIEGMNTPAYALLVGGDYSYTFNYSQKVTMQLEYLAFSQEDIVNLIKTYKGSSDIQGTLDLLMGNINYPIDDFSSISLITMASLDDGSMIFMPVYENQLPGNIKLTASSSIFSGDQSELLSYPGNKASYQLSLSYAF